MQQREQQDPRREVVGKIRTVRSVVEEIGFEGQSLHSINDLTNEQVYGLFELAEMLEPYNRSAVDLSRVTPIAKLTAPIWATPLNASVTHNSPPANCKP